MNTLILPSGATYGIDNAGNRVCTGSQMGRQNRIPSDNSQPLKLRLIRLPFVDGDYDRWGAYWGSPANVWIAQSSEVVAFGDSLQLVEVYVRSNSREQAKAEVCKKLPQARFYR